MQHCQATMRNNGPYVLRSILDDIPLSVEGSQNDVEITCVDYLDGNLYVGTSASELLHYVQISPDAAEKTSCPQYILASRVAPAFAEPSGDTPASLPGVQQILLLAGVGKACILCNSTVTFYSLPELSPVSGSGQVKNCTWVGGNDINENASPEPGQAPVDINILLSFKWRIQFVRVEEEGARFLKNINYAKSTLSVRRDTITCIADTKSYALLDVERQQKIPLMSISSLEELPAVEDVGNAQTIPCDTTGGLDRSASADGSRHPPHSKGHARNSSLGGSILGSIRRNEPSSEDAGAILTPRSLSPAPPFSPQRSQDQHRGNTTVRDKALPSPPPGASSTLQTDSEGWEGQPGTLLQPQIASPSPQEFLLVTGTKPTEPGIGMFVSLDGDATRPPIEFEVYPKQIAVDVCSTESFPTGSLSQDEEDAYVLASLAKPNGGSTCHGLEIQSLTTDSISSPEKHWLTAPGDRASRPCGVRTVTGVDGEIIFREVVERLNQRRFSAFPSFLGSSTPSLKSSDSRTALSMQQTTQERDLFEREDSQDDDSLPDGWEATRVAEEEEFACRLAKAAVRVVFWSQNSIWWAVRCPFILQFDSSVDDALSSKWWEAKAADRKGIFDALDLIRGRDAKTELEFLTHSYARQKTGTILLVNLLVSSGEEGMSQDEIHVLQEILVESKLDARLVLSMIPGLRNEIIEGRRGIWVYGGVKRLAEGYLRSSTFEVFAKDGIQSISPRVMHFLRHFLSSCRKMKGFGSVADEREVSRTVDAALLTVLLELDSSSVSASAEGHSIRAELYEFVDRGVDCFDRAVDILESYHRLYVLSRLYQSRKMAAQVLATWRRIIEGERDVGAELGDGEQRVRDYLTKISNKALVQEYGLWLTSRNPKLGVQVFAEEQARIPRFEPADAIELFRRDAPGGVKYYLEHLVFDKGHSGHVRELIDFYLDIVLGELASSATSRDTVTAAYDAYRALQAPKPSYQHFLMQNSAEDNEVCQGRLRLLQLLGGPHDYDAAAIRARIAQLPGDLLVPEDIILAGREGHHGEALRLLVHSLGDYDTAVTYCLQSGGSGDTYHAVNSRPARDGASTTQQQRSRLFQTVLDEFLAIQDPATKLAQTSALLERFGRWYDVEEVLAKVPDRWAVDALGGFLVGALRRLVGVQRETSIVAALSSAQNQRVSYEWVAQVDRKGPVVEAPS